MTITQIKNHIFFTSIITNKSADNLLSTLYHSQKLSQPLVLHISSDGGDVHSALRIVDYLRQIPVNTIGEGLIASAATLILVSGRKRCMTKYATFLMHQLRCPNSMSGTYHNIKDEMLNIELLHQYMVDIYQQKSTMTRKNIDKQLATERQLTSKQCLEFGLIDQIL